MSKDCASAALGPPLGAARIFQLQKLKVSFCAKSLFCPLENTRFANDVIHCHSATKIAESNNTRPCAGMTMLIHTPRTSLSI